LGRRALSAEEVRRAGILNRVKEGTLKLTTAAQMMRISYRQAKRLWKRYRKSGVKGLVHGNAGRRSHRAKPASLRRQVLALVKSKYSGGVGERFGPTLAAEHLEQEDSIVLDAETLRRWMLQAGLWSRERKRKPYRKRRERKAHFGELVQLDGSFEEWLEDRGPSGCLMNLVDDATGKTLCRLEEQETTWAAAHVLRQWIDKYGVPLALYTDWKNVYVRPPTEKEREQGKAAVTQFGRMCAKLGIEIIAASSPQAKGRVERNHGTHQDRLIKKLRRKKIDNWEAANRYLQEEYLPEHNRRYARAPASSQDMHVAVRRKRQLDEIFCLEEERVLSQDWVVRYQGQLLQVERHHRHQAAPGARIVVREWEDGRLELRYRGNKIAWQQISSLPVAAKPELQSQLPRPRVRPPSDHPWYRGYQGMRAPRQGTYW
jgi:transposase